MQVKSLAGNPLSDSVSPYDAINFLVFRIYEAAKQLQKANCIRRTALLAIDEITWCRFHVQLKKSLVGEICG